MAATRYPVVAYIRRKVQIPLRSREVLELSKHLVLPCSPGRQGPQWAARGISTSTYGLGNGFNEDLMVAMARAGGGNHYYGHTAKDLMEPFERKLDLISRLVLRRLTLRVHAADGAQVSMMNLLVRASYGGWHLVERGQPTGYHPSMRRISAVLLLALAVACPVAHAQDMVRIPAGPFTMGSSDGREDERPAHTVTLAAFEIDRLQVTNAEFARFLERTGTTDTQGRRYFDWDDNDARIHRVDGVWRADKGFENHPVVEASWLGALAYCQSLGKRLPTEAEWEKAARGTDARRYPWGDAVPTAAHARFASGWNDTLPVTAHAAHPSPYGVIGMAGNAWHWVSSAYRPYPYRDDDGRENFTLGPARATRGGGHDSNAEELRTTERGRTLSRAPAAGHHNIGFRCAR